MNQLWFSRQFKVVSIYDLLQNYTLKIANSSFKGAIVITSIELVELKTQFKGIYDWKVFPHKIMTAGGGIAFPPFFFFFEAFNEVVDRIIPSGLIEYWSRFFFNSRYNLKKLEKSEPVVLTMDHLGVGFLLWFICLGISLVCFIVECALFQGFGSIEYLKSRVTESSPAIQEKEMKLQPNRVSIEAKTLSSHNDPTLKSSK